MAGLGESDDDDGGSPVPSRTPEQMPTRRHARLSSYHSHRTDNSDVSLTPPPRLASPFLSPGMSPLSPLRHRFSPRSLSPSSPLYPQSDRDQEDTSQDSRDILAQRLNDLAARLSQEPVEDESINLLHAKVDELENVLNSPESRPSLAKTEHSDPQSFNREEDQDGSELSWKARDPAELLPSDASSFASRTRPDSLPEIEVGQADETETEPQVPGMTVAQAEQLIAEAHNLHKDMETIILNLRDRQEETEHIHTLLITRLERAAQRIIYLEERIKDLEREGKGSETEILNLQIQLKAIEVQCLSYVPQDADQDLRESIDAWKLEFSALKQKRARNREQLYATPTRRPTHSTHTPD